MILFLLLHIYFVSFLDKPEKSAPALSERAVTQRARWSIATDEMDYPVSKLYTDSLRRMGVTIHHQSRWFNGATCEMDETTAAKVAGLSFVTEMEMTRGEGEESTDRFADRRQNTEYRRQNTEYREPSLKMTDAQLEVYNLRPLHEAGYEGQGIVMAICDNGFYHADSLPCFRQAQVLGWFDFTDDTTDIFGEGGDHGTKCLSTITAIADDYYGAATRANYYLMRSEENDTESPKEMDNLVAALETADSLGVNVFSCSLGYYVFDNDAWDLDKTTDLDGQTTRVSRAATIAARKGMLVCVSAGNEAAKPWGTICAPADADSILTVGAVDIYRQIGSFSSYGPSSDGRIKPELCAVGVNAAVYSPYGFATYGNGTSFSTPLIAGLAASLWSALPDENAQSIRERIIRSADRYTHPDTANYLYGYGIPDAWKAYSIPLGIESGEWKVESGKTQKILRGEQILIIRHGHIYNLAGQRVE